MSVSVANNFNELITGLSQDLSSLQSKIKDKKVLIKASTGYPKPPPFSVDIKLVKESVSILRDIGASKISMIEGATTMDGSRLIFNVLGFDRLEGVELVDADDAPLTQAPVPNRIRWDSLYLPRIVIEADFKISLAVLKVEHDGKFYSGVVKNLLGIPPRRIYRGRRPWARGKIHQSLSASVLDLFRVAKFDYGVLDANTLLRGMANTGKTHEFGKYYYGTDLLEIDRKALIDSGFPQAFASFARLLTSK